MRIQTMIAVVAFGLLHCSCISAKATETQLPEITKTEIVKGQDIKPFRITGTELASLLRDLQRTPSRKVMTDLKGMLRLYAILPVDYKDLLTDFSNRTQSGRYDIGVGAWGKLHIRVDHASRIIEDQHSSILDNSPHINTPALGNLLTDTQLRGLLHNFMSLKGKKMEQFTIVTRHFGQRTLLFFVYPQFISPSIPTAYIMDRRIGKVRERSLESLSWAINTEFPVPKDEDDYMALMKLFVRLNTGDRTVIISGVTDIQQYEKQKLDTDMEDALRPPFRINTKRHSIVYVCYTYRRTGGIVERYRFPFGFDGRLDIPSRVLIGRDIGGAQYLQ